MASMTSDRWRAAEVDAEATAPRSRVSGEVAVQGGRDGREVARAIADALSDAGVGCAFIDPASERIVIANDPLARLAGRAPGAIIGRSFLELLEPRDAEAARKYVRGLSVDLGPLTLRPLHEEHPDERRLPIDSKGEGVGVRSGRRPVALAFRSLRREAGPESVFMVATQTASPTEASLRAALEEATEATRQREDLFAFAAHELRSALTPPLLHLQALARSSGREPASAARGLSLAVNQLKRVTALIEQLLDVARVRAGHLTLHRESVELSTIVSAVIERLAPEGEASVSRVEMACEEPVRGQWDPLRLDQIVTNLVSNALKYGGGSKVLVTASASEAGARLTVRDHGPGIPREHLARIFERFERANEDRSVSGSGLGLWIVRRLAEAHGGSVAVSSEPSQGSTFEVRLPFE
jgi:signal transduction histidine kinase